MLVFRNEYALLMHEYANDVALHQGSKISAG